MRNSQDELRKRGSKLLWEDIAPRGLSRQQAAIYFGVSSSLFDRMVKDRLAPGPIRVYGRVIWDRHKLDLAFAALSNDEQGTYEDLWDRLAL